MITEIKQTEAQERYRKAADKYQETIDKIYIAWDRAGFSGDPIHDLYVTAWEMAVYSQSPEMRGSNPPRPRR